MRKRSPILQVAEREVPARFDPILARAGFDLRSDSDAILEGAAAWLYKRTWTRRSGHARPHYVEVSVSVHPSDEPWHVAVVLGEGVNSFPESDWNALGLGTMAKGSRRGGVPGQGRTYRFERADEVERAIAEAASDLERHAGDFLAGDLRRFLELRERQTHGRPEPTADRLLDALDAEIRRLAPELGLDVESDARRAHDQTG